MFYSQILNVKQVLKIKVSEHYGVSDLNDYLRVSDLNDNQNNTIEDEQEKQRNWNALNKLTNSLELNVELSKDNFFRLCTAEEGIRNLEKIINRTLDLTTPKKSSKRKNKTGLPTKPKMLVRRNNVFGISFCSPSHKK